MEHFPNPYPDAGESLDALPLGMQPDGSYAFVCRWCGEYVVMTPDEVHWYLDRQYAMPSRCLRCRRKRRGAIRQQLSEGGAG